MKVKRNDTQRKWSFEAAAMFFQAVAAVLAFTFALSSPAQATDDALKNTLRKEDERLLAAVHRGDKEVWAELTTPDFMYVEDGEVSPRKDFLAGLEEDGLAPLLIEQYDVERLGDTVIVKHLDGLSPRTNADVSLSKFLFLETWQQVAGKWQLRLIHVDRLRVNPVPVKLNDSQITALVGSYRSGVDRYTIQVKGGRLFGVRNESPAEELLAETPDVLFVHGNLFVRKIFRFDEQGKVVKFVDQNVAVNRVWQKEPVRAPGPRHP